MGAHRVHLDFEAFCELDLGVVGLSRYVSHHTFDITCIAYQIFKTGSQTVVKLFRPSTQTENLGEIPRNLCEAVEEGCELHAFNSNFERHVWDCYCTPRLGWPIVDPSQWRCTQALASYHNLPRSLEKCSKLLAIPGCEKDEEGHVAMLDTCKLFDGVRRTPETHPELFEKVYEYCKQDVRAEVAIHNFCLSQSLPETEQKIWALDQKINHRGVPIDRGLCTGAVKVIEAAQKDAVLELITVTDGAIWTVDQVAKMKEFASAHGCDMPPNEKGKPSLAEQDVADVLENFIDLDPDVRRVLECRQSVGLSSVKKFQAALDIADPDDRCRNQYKYGAAGPLRWAGSGVQFQNLKRVEKGKEVTPNLEACVRSGLHDVIAVTDRPIHVLSNLVRFISLAALGKRVVGSDFASIECRMVFWLADDHKTLDKFRSGIDMYKDFAAEHIYNVLPSMVDAVQRQVGKAAILGLGYCMGPDRFIAQVKKMAGLTIDPELAQSVVSAYRGAFPLVTGMWRTMYNGALACVKTGRTIQGAHWAFRMERDWLTVELPSGRKILYFRPEIDPNGKYGPEICYTSGMGKAHLTTPVLVENIDQGLSRDVLADAMLRLDAAEEYLIGHTHDSSYCEIDEQDKGAVGRIRGIMEIVPEWVRGLPIVADTHVGTGLG